MAFDFLPGPDVENEARIEWHEDPYQYPYLRETWMMRPSRTRPVARDTLGTVKRIIGYAVLRKNAPPSSVSPWGRTYWHRRIWWLYLNDAKMPQDSGIYGPTTGRYPVEAVSPFAVKTGRISVPIDVRPSLRSFETSYIRFIEWMMQRQNGKTTLREIQRAGLPGLSTIREVLTIAGRLAELNWCWLYEERRGKTKQRVFVVELIRLAGEEMPFG